MRNKEKLKITLYAWGLCLILLAIWFWVKYGFGILGLTINGFSIIPPITSLVIFAGVIVGWFLVKDDKIKNIVFGEDADTRTRILDMLGMIFTGFGLMITILWGLMGANLNLHPYIVYIQSFLFVSLFFYFVLTFYIMLSGEKKEKNR
jgi:hypothetical protein